MLKALSFGALALVLAGPTCHAQDNPPPPPGGMMHPPAFADLDANKDGVLSKDEFAAPMMQHFADVDTDGNGTISPAEFDAAHQRMGEMHGHMHEGWGPPGGPGGWHHDHGPMDLQALDTDHDGKVSFAEFSAPMKSHFDEMDANHDGTLDASELPQRRDGDGPPPPGGN